MIWEDCYGLRHGSALKTIYFSDNWRKFSSQHTHWVTHNHLHLTTWVPWEPCGFAPCGHQHLRLNAYKQKYTHMHSFKWHDFNIIKYWINKWNNQKKLLESKLYDSVLVSSFVLAQTWDFKKKKANWAWFIKVFKLNLV